ncbi:MAG TPA: exodeoxyribonuclease VII small subunit, partial [Planctomycetaceae bacterium]|nr:exodeoxyribonuclease VII small subunit [Planctomycetaceae bacterium]
MSEVSETRQPLSFEAALSELQRIVAELEDGRVGLEESLERFERGIALLKTCHQVLEHAEQRIEVLVGQKSDGTPVTQPFDASATADVDSP